MTTPIKFVVANYGTRHAGMLLVHLHSITQSHPGSRVSVYWQDMPIKVVDALRDAFPNAEFIRTRFDFVGNPVHRIASKTLCWHKAAEDNAHEPQIVFADADTLVRRDVAAFFKGNADLIFTDKKAPIPLNTGVMLVRGGSAATAFFQTWRDRTLDILASPELLRQSKDSALPYGAPDQMSFFQMIGYKPEQREYSLDINDLPVKLRAEPCPRLNETESRPLDDDTHIIHYKGGWQAILLDGRPFSRFRPRIASWEMFALYLSTFLDGLAHLNNATKTRFLPLEFGVVVPWYFEPHTRSFQPVQYAAWRVKEAAKRAWLMATGQLAESA